MLILYLILPFRRLQPVHINLVDRKQITPIVFSGWMKNRIMQGLVSQVKEMKEDYALEAYEAACNQIKEAFCKKVDECKESNMTPGEREQEEAN